MNAFYSGCLCYVKVLDNDGDATVKVFAESDEFLYPIVDYIMRLYDSDDEVSIADVLFGAWVKGYGSEMNIFAKYILNQNLSDYIVIRRHRGNEKYAEYVLTISGFKIRES